MRLALAAAAALLLTACSGPAGSRPDAGSTPVLAPSATTDTTSPATTPPATPPRPPRVSACYRLGYDEVLAPTLAKEPVPCTGIHTAVTYYVGSFDATLPVDGPAVHRLESTICPRRFATFVGGSLEARRLSMLRSVWFSPTVDQAARGGHWFQCVAIALRGEQRLALLRGPLHGVLDAADGRDHYALCGTAQPGSAGFEQRICAATHTWKALRTVVFGTGRYPGADRARAVGQEPCQDAGRAASSDPLNFRWSYQWPSREQWLAGQTYGVCWAPT
jgi:hypothetical protein